VLREIRIQNLGVIDDAVLELSPGLNVVTGETGAGKTMVVSGLGLLLGARGDASLVRTGAQHATVEGIVDVAADHPASERAAEAGADLEDGLILARSVSAEGRSRAHVGGRSAPVGVLSDLRELLVAVHGQADQWRLRQPEQHRVVLDGFGGASVAGPLSRYTALYDEYHQLRAELEELRTMARDRAREIDVLRSGLEEIEAVDPQPGEDHELRTEDERLAHAEGLRGSAGQAHALVAGGSPGGFDDSASDDRGTVVELVAEARAMLATVSSHDSALADLERRLQELGYLAADLGADLAAYLSDVDIDPQRLAWVQERRAELGRLQRKYGDTVDDVLTWGKQSAVRLDQLMTADDRADGMQARLEELEGELTSAGSALTRARRAAAEEFGSQVTRELAHLAMGKAVVRVSVEPRETFTRHGVDDVEILLAANPGAPARSVAKAASGGELSRVMLALEVVTGSSDVPTFVFDEVDAGVGGKAALDVGARLAALARSAQVIVVTHLAQVAAYADRHLVVRKTDDGHITASGVVSVAGEDRLRELARMMAGVDSEVAIEHARELVSQAGTAGR
jgi:DNA repair protein RecN (Recombination protein N)